MANCLYNEILFGKKWQFLSVSVKSLLVRAKVVNVKGIYLWLLLNHQKRLLLGPLPASHLIIYSVHTHTHTHTLNFQPIHSKFENIKRPVWMYCGSRWGGVLNMYPLIIINQLACHHSTSTRYLPIFTI